MGNKQDQCAAAGITSYVTACVGIPLMIATGPVGVVAGAAMFGGGIGGTVNAISQSNNDKDDFSLG
jgi:hypothetical protein